MKTTRNTCKRLLAVALVLLMALGLALPVMAATVNIIPDPSYTTTPTGKLENNPAVVGRFHAYQIFAGGLNTDPTDDFEDYKPNDGTDLTPDSNTGYDNPNANWLTEVTWGSGIADGMVEALLVALMNDGSTMKKLGISSTLIADDPRYASVNKENFESLTLGQMFKAALDYAGYEIKEEDGKITISSTTDATLANTASVIARVLSDLTGIKSNNAALTEAFAKVVADKDDNNKYKYLKAEADAVSTWDNDKKQWVIDTNETVTDGDDAEEKTKENNGYYLIVDTYPETDNTETNKVTSDYLVGVFGNTTIKIKANGAEEKKTIGSDRKNTSSYEQGQYIPFTLEGKIAPNYVNYNEYFFAFRDEMSKGLTLDKDTITVYLEIKNPLYGTVDGEKKTLNLNITDLILTTGFSYDGSYKERGTAEQANGYQFVVKNENGATTFDIVFPNLKKLGLSSLVAKGLLDQKYVDAGLEISGGDTITIKYEAYLNEGAVIDDANPNKFHLEFSNNPNSTSNDTEGTTKTPDDVVYVYDFGINLDKYDASTNTKDKLANAGFSLSKTETLYELENDDGNKVLVTASDLQDYFTDVTNDIAAEKTLGELGKNYVDGRYSDYKFTGTKKENTVLYAILKKNDDATTYDIVGWIAEADLKKVFNPETGAALTVENWKTSVPGSKIKAYAISATELADGTNYYFAGVTTATGDLNFQGLAAEITYTITEVYAPKGYDMITKPITVKFTDVEYFTEEDLASEEAENSEFAVNMLKTLKAVVTGPDIDGTQTQTIVENGEPASDDGFIEFAAVIAVANMPNGWLPGTGGIGTTLFYIAGGLLLAGAALYLVLSAVKKNKAQEQ